MNGKTGFIMGVHSHLPNGAPEEDFESLYHSKIRPLVSALYQFPAINVVFHFSGVLFHWMERRHPELLVLIEDLLGRKQAELLGGGFYEPAMPLLPQADRIGQIEMLTTYLRKQFGRRPQGCLFARAWEQNLVGPLESCGMNYTFLDEAHFETAGAERKGPFFTPCITEDQGKITTVFPIFSSLANLKPALMLEKIKSAGNINTGYQIPVTVFPEFTINPGENAETEYRAFFEELMGADTNIEFTLPGRVYKNLRGLLKLYFTGNPPGPDETPPRRFLTTHPEAANIYAKMVHTRVLINQLRGDKARKQAALEELWKAQDSALFTVRGIENAAVKKAAYRALLEAESITREKGFSPSLSLFDYDLDGEDEYVFQDEKLNCYIKTKGASLFELDYLPKNWNSINVWNDCLEPSGAVPVFGDAERVPGTSTTSRFLGDEIFEPLEFDRNKKQAQFRLPPKSGIPFGAIAVTKTWTLKHNVLSLLYKLENSGTNAEDFFLVPLINVSFSGGSETALKVFCLNQNGREAVAAGPGPKLFLQNTGGIEFRDVKNEIALSLESNRAFDTTISAIHAHQTNNGAAQTTAPYCYTSVRPALKIHLEPGKIWSATFTLKINS